MHMVMQMVMKTVYLVKSLVGKQIKARIPLADIQDVTVGTSERITASLTVEFPNDKTKLPS